MSQLIPLVFGRKMVDEHQSLVTSRSDLGEHRNTSSLSSFGSIMKNEMNMAYAEDKIEEASGDAATINRAPDIQHMDSNDSGELIDLDETRILSQFHEDALKTTCLSSVQLHIVAAATLALAASSIELAAIPFVLPSAEIELCIREHEKSWLVIISVMGLCVGSACYGILASRVARRRALMSALAVNLLFAVTAAFMPTYGTSMCARFWSACGCGGIAPSALAYVCESQSRSRRRFGAAVAFAGLGFGALYATAIAKVTLPPSGIHTLIEDKEHFSAWHRYLLLCCLPSLAALIATLWSQESPLFLMHEGRELDAVHVYQKIHDGHKEKLRASGGLDQLNDYRLGELHLPTKRAHRHSSVKVFLKSIFQIFSNTYRKTTLILGTIIFLTVSLQFFIATYVPTTVLKMENERFEMSKRTINNVSIENQFYNTTIENIDYVNCSFIQCTFRDMFLSHVTFRNCSFYNVTFTNIKTSYATFKGSLFVNTTMIDTDIEARRDMDSCILNSSVIRGIDAPCPRNLAFHIDSIYKEQLSSSIAMLIAAGLAVLPYQMAPLVAVGALLTLITPVWAVVSGETALYIIEGASRGLLVLMLFNGALIVVETYPVHLRCTAHGLLMSTAYVGALILRCIGALALTPLFSCLLILIMSILLTVVSHFVTPSFNYLM